MRRKCGRCFSTTWISVSCSIPPVMSNSLRRSMPRRRSCRPSCGPPVQAPAFAQPTPDIALAVSGMNDVLNSQGYTQAAWWNRIPFAAWGLMGAIAICSVALVGFGARRPKAEFKLLLVLPLVVAIAFFLIADIDSPRRGLIHVKPQNLLSLAQSLRAQ